MRRVSTFALFVLIFTAGTFGQATPRESLLVLSKHDHTLAIVDPSTLKVVAKMPVGEDPHEVIATADGKMAYVSNYGGGGAGALQTLAVIDLVNQKALAPIDLGALKGPHGLDFAGGKVWFTAEAAKAFGSVDPASGKLTYVSSTPTEKQPRGFAIDPSGRYLVVSGEKSDTISSYAIDKDSGALKAIGKYPTGKGSNWVEIVSFE